MLLNSVVLPDPLGPKIEINSPLLTLKFTPFKARVPFLKFFLKLFISSIIMIYFLII